MKEGIYFPAIIKTNVVFLVVQIILKTAWIILGGWLWRLVKKIIFSKLRTNTFQGPTSLGASMVAYLLLSVLFLIVALIAGWPVWYILVWWLLLAMGKFIPAPMSLLLNRLSAHSGSLIKLKSNLELFEKRISEEFLVS